MAGTPGSRCGWHVGRSHRRSVRCPFRRIVNSRVGYSSQASTSEKQSGKLRRFECEGGQTGLLYRQEPHNMGYETFAEKYKDAISWISASATADVREYLSEGSQAQAPKAASTLVLV